MRRYWVETKAIAQDRVHFTGDTHHHICDVCRMQVGSRFEVLTEGGHAYLVEMQSVQGGKKPESWARILQERTIAPLPKPHVHLALSMSRFVTMDAVVEKAVELGVLTLHPFFSDFSFVRSQDKISPQKIERWNKIVQSATQQSGRGDLMKVEAPLPLEKILEKMNRTPNAMGLFAYEGEAQAQVRQILSQLKAGKPDEIWIFVGSEGGFSEREVQLFSQLSMPSATLGAQVLRVETACVALVSVIKYEFG